jgi:hypothetical protein
MHRYTIRRLAASFNGPGTSAYPHSFQEQLPACNEARMTTPTRNSPSGQVASPADFERRSTPAVAGGRSLIPGDPKDEAPADPACVVENRHVAACLPSAVGTGCAGSASVRQPLQHGGRLHPCRPKRLPLGCRRATAGWIRPRVRRGCSRGNSVDRRGSAADSDALSSPAPPMYWPSWP